MCLDLNPNQRQSKIAEDDIICYKVLDKNYVHDKLTTIFKRSVVNIGKLYTSEFTFNHDSTSVQMGLHSFVHEDDAKKLMEYVNRYKSNNEHELNKFAVVVKCIIPKGSSYYEGNFEYYTDLGREAQNVDSYASNVLIYNEIIHERIQL